MGWFDEQVRQRKRIDEELYQGAYRNINTKITGKRESDGTRKGSIRSAIDDVFDYYHYRKVEIPSNIEDPKEQIEYAAGTVGMMKANISLKDGWFTDCFGPIICFFAEDNLPVALFPRGFASYYYFDPATGQKVNVRKKDRALFKDEAIGFYEPLPLKQLGISDLVTYMKNRMAFSDYVYLIIVSAILVGISMIMPAATGALTGEVVSNSNYVLFAALVTVVATALIFNGILSAVSAVLSARLRWKMTIPVEQAVMQRILTLPVPFFRKYSAGELTNRADSISEICKILIDDVLVLGVQALLSLTLIGQISLFAQSLAMPALTIIALTVVISVLTTFMQMGISKKRMKIMAEESGLTYSLITGIQKIKLAGAEKRIFAKWANLYAEGAALLYNPPFLIKISNVLTTSISLIGTVIFYTIAIKNNVAMSDYFAFNVAYAEVFAAFTQLSAASLAIARIKPVLDMAEPILKAEPEKNLKKNLITRLNGSIELNGVYFRYSEQTPYILNNFSLKIKAGEYVAIVGKTGCGKSTLVRLLLGFEKPEKGIVFFDGKDIERIDLKSLRRRIGSVIQDGRLTYGDIYQNISIASDKLTMDEAWEAAEMAGIADDIRAMPMGMHTIISEGQGGISGGQRQRLLIARAVASKPRVLIFDEATSALDNITQKEISEALDGLKCTRIVIAHRLSTIRNCDRILVLDGGKIVEEGNYEALMEKNGYFAELVKRQQL